MLNVQPVVQEEFGIEPAVDLRRLHLKLTGTGDMAAVAPLRDALRQAHSEVIRLGLAAVDIDIRALYLLNSSCLKALLSFIHTIQVEGPTYRVEFITDPRLSWQQRALAALVRLAPELASIRES